QRPNAPPDPSPYPTSASILYPDYDQTIDDIHESLRNAPKTIEFSPKIHPARPSPDLRRPTPIIQNVLKTSQSSPKRRSKTKNYISHPEISMLYRPPRGVGKIPPARNR